MGGGDMVRKVRFAGTTFADLPLKFEAGTANYVGAVCLGEAMEYLREIGMDGIAEYEHRLAEYAADRLSAVEGLRIYGTTPDKCSILSFNAEGVHAYDMGMILDKLCLLYTSPPRTVRSSAQKPRRVIDCERRLYEEVNANVHRGVHYLSGQMTELFEEARERVRSFIGAASREEIVFTSGATAAVNAVA